VDVKGSQDLAGLADSAAMDGELDHPGEVTCGVASEWRELEERLGYTFADGKLLRRAMTHASRAREEGSSGVGSYQRLEFLGDAVLAAVLAEALYELLPSADEGELTRRLVDLARGRTQIELARELELARFLRFGEDLGDGARQSERLLEDAFESVIGAIFVDGGYTAVQERILDWYGNLLVRAEVFGQDNAKGRLQELLQDRQPQPEIVYEIVDAWGPDNDRVYEAVVKVDGNVHGSGRGRRKKDAEQAAARDALNLLEAADEHDGS